MEGGIREGHGALHRHAADVIRMQVRDNDVVHLIGRVTGRAEVVEQLAERGAEQVA